MKKFLVLYKAPVQAFEKAMKSTPEQQKAGMDAWTGWTKKAGAALVDMGGPLGKSGRITKGGGLTDVKNDLGGFSVMQAESKEALGPLMKEHPHFMIGEGSSIEIVEIVPIPGM